MKTLHLLLGGSDRRLNSNIEATVLDVCYNRAAVACTNTPRLGEFLRQSSCGCYGIIILDANHVQSEPGRPEPGPETLVQTVWTVRNQCSAPLIVVGAAPEMEYRFLEAGADSVLGGSWTQADLRTEIQRVLYLPEPEAPAPRKNWSLSGLFRITN